MRMIVMGVFGFIFVGLIGLQGLAVHKREANTGKAMTDTIALYQESPSHTRKLIKTAVRECLEDVAGGALPEYYTDFVGDLMVRTIRFAGDNAFETTDDPAVQAFVADLTEETNVETKSLGLRLTREPAAVQRRFIKMFKKLEGKPVAVAGCMGAKVMRMEEDA